MKKQRTLTEPFRIKMLNLLELLQNNIEKKHLKKLAIIHFYLVQVMYL